MRNRKLWSVAIAAILIVAGVVDFARCLFLERTTVRAVSECGGTTGSEGIGWPLRKEYLVTFHRALSSEEFERLEGLNSLRGKVAVTFVDCEMSQGEIREALAKLQGCYLMKVTGSESHTLRELVRREIEN